MGVLINGSTFPGTSTSQTIYKYEPVSYIFSASGGDTSVTLVSATTLIRSFVAQVGAEVHFEAPSGYSGNVSTAENIVLQSVPGGVTYTFNVTIAAGRFILTPPLTAFTFNKNTSIADTYGSPILFTAPLPISLPRTLTTLPPGIGFVQVTPTTFYLTGTPLAVTPAAAYNVLGFGTPDTSKIISKNITITVNDETMSTSLTGGSNVSNMIVDFPITDRTITSTYPNRFSGNLVYTWSPALPDGIRFIDLSGNTVSSGFAPTDSNSTIRLVGTPSLAAAYQFAGSNLSNYAVTVRATRQTSPQINASVSLNFSFGETVLFDPVSNVAVYTNAPISVGTIPFTARTYFKTPTPGMQYIVATDGLPTGLILSYTTGSSNAYLAGTSTGTGSGTYRLTAQNSNGVYRDVSVNITIATDTVQFSSLSTPADVCYNFVISRPLNQPLTGYYPSNIQYIATANSGTNVTYSMTNIPSGVTTSTVGGAFLLSGIPNTITAATSSVITATSATTGASATRTLYWETLNDRFTLVSPLDICSTTQNYIQHRPITPFQLEVSTLSGRNISAWSLCNSGIYAAPDGLSISGQGKISGAPTTPTTAIGSGFKVETFRAIASTGYTSGFIDICYNVIYDYLLIGFDEGSNVTVPTVFSNVEMYGLPYSGRTEPFVLQVRDGSLRLRGTTNPTVSITNNFLSGDFSIADPLFPYYYFDVCGTFLGQSYNIDKVGITVTNADYAVHLGPLVNLISNERFPTGGDPTYSPAIGNMAIINDRRFVAKAASGVISQDYFTWNTNTFTTGNVRGATAFCDVNVSTGNVAVAVAGERMYRSVDGGQSWSTLDLSSSITPIGGLTGYYYLDGTYGTFSGDLPYMCAVATDNASNWVCLGRAYNSLGQERTVVRYSSDDGVTWTDDVINPPFVNPGSNNKLFYNGGRYFLTQNATGSRQGVYYATPADYRTWSPAGIFPTAGGANGLAANGNTLMVGGSTDASGNELYLSTNNGNTWTALTNPFGAGSSVLDVAYGDGKWAAGSFISNVYSTDNGATWSEFLSPGGFSQFFGADRLNLVYDKSGWMMLYVPMFDENVYLDGYNQDTLRSFAGSFALNILPVTNKPSVTSANYGFKRLVYSVIRPAGTPTLTMITPAQGFQESIIDPASSAITLYQYCPISPPISVNTDAPVEYIWYWARNLPQGLSLTFSQGDGDPAFIVGTPSKFTDVPQKVQLRSVTAFFGGHAYKEVDFRVLIPFVMKKQDNAGSYTAFLRQYVTVNGAQAARDSVALPVETRPIGEFMHPGAPMVSTDSNCPC